MLTRRRALTGLTAMLAAPALASPINTPRQNVPAPAVTAPAVTKPRMIEMAYSRSSPRNLLDFYRPPGKGPFPALLDIHGGGFLTGDKRALPVPEQVLARGIAVVRMNYRLSNQALWPAQQDDVISAAGFLQAHAGELELEPKRLAIGGRSAGAFIAVSAALSMLAQGRAPAAVVDFYGPMDFGSMDADMARLGVHFDRPPADSAQSVESLLVGYAVGQRRKEATAMGPVGRLRALPPGTKLPPLFIRHGRDDTIVSAAQAEHLRDAWHDVDPRAPINIALLDAQGHGTAGFASAAVLDPLADFLARHLQGTVSG